MLMKKVQRYRAVLNASKIFPGNVLLILNNDVKSVITEITKNNLIIFLIKRGIGTGPMTPQQPASNSTVLTPASQ